MFFFEEPENILSWEQLCERWIGATEEEIFYAVEIGELCPCSLIKEIKSHNKTEYKYKYESLFKHESPDSDFWDKKKLCEYCQFILSNVIEIEKKHSDFLKEIDTPAPYSNFSWLDNDKKEKESQPSYRDLQLEIAQLEEEKRVLNIRVDHYKNTAAEKDERIAELEQAVLDAAPELRAELESVKAEMLTQSQKFKELQDSEEKAQHTVEFYKKLDLERLEKLEEIKKRKTFFRGELDKAHAQLVEKNKENASLTAKLKEAEQQLQNSSSCGYEGHGLCSLVIRMRKEGCSDEKIAAYLYDEGEGCSIAQVGALLRTKEEIIKAQSMQDAGKILLGMKKA